MFREIKSREEDIVQPTTVNNWPWRQGVGCFKCNSAVLNGMLSILNERLFFNDGQPITVPLETMVGASNELPEDREELGALWDRFLLRYIVSYIKDPRNYEKMLLAGSQNGPVTTITMQELKQAQTEAQTVDIKCIVPRLAALRQKMTEMNIPISDRRWRQLLGVIKAHAWMEGRTKATDDDLAVLAHCLWTEPTQINEVRQVIMALANPLDQEALALADEGMEIWQKAINETDETKKTKIGMEANAKLKTIAHKLDELRQKAQEKGRGEDKITEALQQVIAQNKEVLMRCMDLSL